MSKILKYIFVALIFFSLPVLIFAQTGPIIPCTDNCGYQDLLKLVNNIINWIIKISIPVSAGIFAWAGFKFMLTAVVDERTAAKRMMQNVFIGFVVVLSAWIIVTTITNNLLSKEFKDAVPVEGVK